MLWWMLLCALVVWQLLLAAWAVDQAANAARTASRVEARGGDPEKAARYAVSKGLRRGPEGRGQRARRRRSASGSRSSCPGLGHERLRATRSAILPG